MSVHEDTGAVLSINKTIKYSCTGSSGQVGPLVSNGRRGIYDNDSPCENFKQLKQKTHNMMVPASTPNEFDICQQCHLVLC